MMYKNKDKQREATKERVRRYRKGTGVTTSEEEGVTKGVAPLEEQGVTEGSCDDEGVTTQSLSYLDIIDKLTDKVWRTKLEKICHAFKASNNPHYVHDVWLGDTNLSTVCDWLECTR